MKNLHILPKFADRWSYLYLEHGRLEVEASGLVFYDQDGQLVIPNDQVALLLLGPGTTLTHAAMKSLAENNTLVCWVGEQSVRVYAHNTGGTHSSVRLLRQAALFCNEEERRKVVIRMYQKRFTEPIPADVTIETLRGREGYRVRQSYQEFSAQYGITWRGRSYKQEEWDWGDPINRALSSANACLYGVCHAAILSAGYSAAIGFIHTGKLLSFVYDIADLYKTMLTIPAAFQTVAESENDVERRTRHLCRDMFHEVKLLERILPDIAEVLDAGNDLGENAGEFEGRAVSLADRAEEWRIPWESEREGS